MLVFLKKSMCLTVSIGIIVLGFPPASGSKELPVNTSGSATADEAARYESPTATLSPSLTQSLGFNSLLADTTETVFLEEEEERNLIREIVVWFIGAAFVGYFIVKVFLQGDTDEVPEEDPGKQLPQTNWVR